MDKLDKLLDAQEKTEQNNKKQGKRQPNKKLPNKQHSTNK
ncbi:HemX protein [Desulfosporosinus sp. Tol-M]|jgi:hypothetical protein|nr:HemX protein [Desulfosporosinus sp. Tol-M]